MNEQKKNHAKSNLPKIRIIAEIKELDDFEELMKKHEYLIHQLMDNVRAMYSTVAEITFKLKETTEINQ